MKSGVVISTRVRLMIALGVVVAILCVLIGTAISHASSYYLTVTELEGKGSVAVGSAETVSGVIEKGSVHYDASTQNLAFQMTDGNGSVDRVPVKFHGDEPEYFNAGWPVIVTGSLASSGTFEATKLLVKCPSKYQVKSETYTASS